MLTAEEATELTEQIQAGLDRMANTSETVMVLIERARAGGAHQALGYASWPAYVTDKFSGALARLDKSERVRVVELMSDQRMSTRVIASVVGVSKDTVSRDLRAGVSSDTPAVDVAEPTLTTDGSRGKFVQRAAEARGQGMSCEDDTGPNGVEITGDVVGIDGKTYSRDKPRRLRRAPLPQAYRGSLVDLDRRVRELEGYHADGRHREHREALQECASHLEDYGSRLLKLAQELRGDVQ